MHSIYFIKPDKNKVHYSSKPEIFVSDEVLRAQGQKRVDLLVFQGVDHFSFCIYEEYIRVTLKIKDQDVHETTFSSNIFYDVFIRQL